MYKIVTHPVNEYRPTLLGSAFGKLHGWIQLLNDGETVGYIYLTDVEPIPDDRLGSSDYIVMHQRSKMLPDLINFLRNETQIYIQLFDPENGNPPSTFLYVGDAEPSAEAESVAEFVKSHAHADK